MSTASAAQQSVPADEDTVDPLTAFLRTEQLRQTAFQQAREDLRRRVPATSSDGQSQAKRIRLNKARKAEQSDDSNDELEETEKTTLLSTLPAWALRSQRDDE